MPNAVGAVRFQQECAILCDLRHPSCVSFFGFSYDDEDFLFIMELCGGGDLRKVMKSRPEQLFQRRCDIMVQLAEGVDYLHTSKIVHRDIKAENVLFQDIERQDWKCKLCDYGEAKQLLKDQTCSTMTGAVGTVRYMAPELIDSSGDIPYFNRDRRTQVASKDA